LLLRDNQHVMDSKFSFRNKNEGHEWSRAIYECWYLRNGTR